jgi:hypothetical protein
MGERNALTTYIEVAIPPFNEQRIAATIFWWQDVPRGMGMEMNNALGRGYQKKTPAESKKNLTTMMFTRKYLGLLDVLTFTSSLATDASLPTLVAPCSVASSYANSRLRDSR